MEKICGIYEIRSISHPNRVYIGSSVNIMYRWRKHRERLIKGNHHNGKLQQHYNKYGAGDLSYKVIIECFPNSFIYYEQFFIDINPTCFNLAPADRCAPGFGRIPWNKGLKKPYTLETIAQMSESAIKRHHPKGNEVSENTRKKIGDAHRGKHYNIGHKHTEESIEKMRRSKLGHNNAMYGKPSHNAKMVINLETGIFYDSIKKAAFSACLPAYNLEKMLKNPLKNKTKFILV